jgi:hypothetical protein
MVAKIGKSTEHHEIDQSEATIVRPRPSLKKIPMSSSINLSSLPNATQPWPSNIYAASKLICDVYRNAKAMIQAENFNVHRVRYHTGTVVHDALPILQALEDLAEEEGSLSTWIEEVKRQYEELLEELEVAEKTALGQCVSVFIINAFFATTESHRDASSHIGYVQPFTVQRKGNKGRPRKLIEVEFLKEALNPSRNISQSKLAAAIGVHRNTLRLYLQEYGIDRDFSQITDGDLDNLVKSFRQQNPGSGVRYVRGFLREQNLRIQKQRVIASIARVDGLGQQLRRQRQRQVLRQAYRVARPNALWHIDGHHKLILWGIVIHGSVDGFSRTVSSLLNC